MLDESRETRKILSALLDERDVQRLASGHLGSRQRE